MAEKEKEKTPMRRQYEEIKSRYPDCMLLFLSLIHISEPTRP